MAGDQLETGGEIDKSTNQRINKSTHCPRSEVGDQMSEIKGRRSHRLRQTWGLEVRGQWPVNSWRPGVRLTNQQINTLSEVGSWRSDVR
ncbi:MAG TPA: hypothetical protein PK939_06330, partial [Bacteroidales bacterium]|nr:hypothetical protein [Bacteroidales bacterium]